MYYKLTLEKLDYDRNTLKTTAVILTEEMVSGVDSIDVLKMAADNLVDKFRHEHNENTNARNVGMGRATLPMDLDTPRLIERKIVSLFEKEKDMFEEIIDIVDSENSGLSAEQRLKEIKNYIKNDIRTFPFKQ